MNTPKSLNTFPVVMAATCAALTMGVSFAAAPATLAHRWSFNGNLNDSVTTGASNATIVDPDNNPAAGGTADLTTNAGQVTLGGGGKDQSAYVSLGSNLLKGKTTAVTLEFWATQIGTQNWARIFDFGTDTNQYFIMSWSRGTNAAQDTITWRVGGVEVAVNDMNAPYNLGQEYHIVVVIEPGAGANGLTRVTEYAAPSSDPTMGVAKATFDTTYTLANFADPNDFLGRSQWPDETAHASYNEVRIWNGAMTSPEIDARQAAGADSTTTKDTDGDGMPDWWETAHGLNPNVNDAALDPDKDGSTNLQEYLAGSDPQDAKSGAADTDGDGLPDAWEITHFGNLSQGPTDDPDGDGATNLDEYTAGSDPLDATSFPDTDKDGMNDVWEKKYFGANFNTTANGASGDPDGDGFTNLQEFLAGTDPTKATSTPVVPALAHRWSFNGSLNDSVGSSNATIVDPDNNPAVGGTANLTLIQNAVFMGGGNRDTSAYVSLGTNLLKGYTTPFTIELWATPYSMQSWSRIFDFGGSTTQYFMTSWNNNGNQALSRVSWTNGGKENSADASFTLNYNTKYHIVVSIEPPAGKRKLTRVNYYIAPADGATTMGPAVATFYTSYNFTSMSDVNDWLGRSQFGDATANASYDEFRIWNGLLPAAVRDIFQVKGPDDVTVSDSDNDKLPDLWEMTVFGALNTQSGATDSDNDRYTNLQELLAGTDPTNPVFTPADTDGDGMPDDFEYQYFGNLNAGPYEDADGDGAYNIDEYTAGTDPTNKASFPDVDKDGISDGWELDNFGDLTTANATSDYDHDGITDLAEFLAGTNPKDPLSPVNPLRDADGDGLDDVWEIQHFGSIDAQNGSGDADHDGSTNLEEFLAGSDPNNANSTKTDIDGDGIADQVQVYEFKAVGTTGVKDATGQFTGLVRLPGSGTDATYSPNDPNLTLAPTTGSGTLGIKAAHADIFGQVGMPQLEALGIPLSSLNIGATTDFTFRARFVNLPDSGGGDQVGVFVGDSTTMLTRFGRIDAAGGYGTNTNGTTDTGNTRINGMVPGKAMMLEVTRRGGVWTMTLDGTTILTPTDQPSFLNGPTDLIAGVFALDLTNRFGTSYVDSMTLVKYGTNGSGNTADTDNDGMDDAWEMAKFGNLAQTADGDYDNDGVSNILEFAFNGDPTSAASRGMVTSALADTDGNGKKELTLTIAARTGATFAAGANGSMVATVAGLTYTIQGTTDLVNFTGTVSEVGTPTADSGGYQMHTFRLVSSDGLAGKGFLRASAAKQQ